MVQPILQTDLVSGNRLTFNPQLQLLILKQLELILDAESRYQNQLIYRVRDAEMREVYDLAKGMKEAISGIRKAAVDARADLASEVARAHINASKVKSMTQDLKSANFEVEEFLGESGSNFPPSGEELITPPQADINGVTLTKK